jgi:hypothetical protein
MIHDYFCSLIKELSHGWKRQYMSLPLAWVGVLAKKILDEGVSMQVNLHPLNTYSKSEVFQKKDLRGNSTTSPSRHP